MNNQIFLSYKTKDSHVARLVAAWLIHNLVDTWFAEKDILLYGRDEASVDRALKEGITSCSHAILFTNEKYAESDWCKEELKSINERLPARNILIVGLSDHPRTLDIEFRLSDQIRRISMSPNTPVDLILLEREMRALGWPLPDSMNGIEKLSVDPTVPFKLPFLDMRLNLHDWQHFDSEEYQDQGKCVMRHDYFTRELNGPLQLCVTSTKYSSGQIEEACLNSNGDDRKLFDQSIKFAKQYSDLLEEKCARTVDITGVHLVFFGEQSHFAMSYNLDDDKLGKLATRKYDIIVRDEHFPQDVYEFVFTFNTYGSQKRLWSLSSYFDYVVTCFVPLSGTRVTLDGSKIKGRHPGQWTDGNHPLLRHLLSSSAYKSARPSVLAVPWAHPTATEGNVALPNDRPLAAFDNTDSVSADFETNTSKLTDNFQARLFFFTVIFYGFLGAVVGWLWAHLQYTTIEWVRAHVNDSPWNFLLPEYTRERTIKGGVIGLFIGVFILTFLGNLGQKGIRLTVFLVEGVLYGSLGGWCGTPILGALLGGGLGIIQSLSFLLNYNTQDSQLDENWKSGSVNIAQSNMLFLVGKTGRTIKKNKMVIVTAISFCVKGALLAAIGGIANSIPMAITFSSLAALTMWGISEIRFAMSNE